MAFPWPWRMVPCSPPTVTAPAPTSSSCMKLRPFSGSSSTCCWLTRLESSALSVLRATACADASTVSVTAPGFSCGIDAHPLVHGEDDAACDVFFEARRFYGDLVGTGVQGWSVEVAGGTGHCPEVDVGRGIGDRDLGVRDDGAATCRSRSRGWCRLLPLARTALPAIISRTVKHRAIRRDRIS